jgi:hypothetical protein
MKPEIGNKALPWTIIILRVPLLSRMEGKLHDLYYGLSE